MKLEWLDCGKTQVVDFAPLKNMPLKNLVIDFKPRVTPSFCRSIKTSGYDRPQAGRSVILKDVEVPGKPDFQQWMKDVAAMPAEKQVEAVSKKLVEMNPGFDGTIDGRNIENNVVTRIDFRSDQRDRPLLLQGFDWPQDTDVSGHCTRKRQTVRPVAARRDCN